MNEQPKNVSSEETKLIPLLLNFLKISLFEKPKRSESKILFRNLLLGKLPNKCIRSEKPIGDLLKVKFHSFSLVKVELRRL